MTKCISCNSRKGKRNCPALASLICSQCCGAKKVKEIDCPEDCFYIGNSQQYFTDRKEAQQISDFERQMKKIIGSEENYLLILQNIEYAIYKVYSEKGDITDKNVETALDYLIEMGKTQLDLTSKFLTKLPKNVQNIVDAINAILGKQEEFAKKKEQVIDILRCIYRILDSVRTHYDPKNDCSYLDFIGQFFK